MAQALKQDFLAITDWDGARILSVLELARRIKQARPRRRDPKPFRDRHMALVFQKPSLRTRMSFELGFHELGGTTIYMSPAEVGLGEREPVADVARVISRYADVIVARVFAHALVESLARHASVPVVNALSDYNHPCQILADLLTMLERRGSLEGLKVAWVGDGNNVATSWINAARRLPIEVRLACPEGFSPSPDVLKAAQAEAPGRVFVMGKPSEAVSGADVVYADTWYSMGQEQEKVERRRRFAGFTVDEELMRLAPEAWFLHCLPAHRGDEVTDAVIEGPRSLVFDQAENRLHAQKALLLSLFRLEGAFL